MKYFGCNSSPIQQSRGWSAVRWLTGSLFQWSVCWPVGSLAHSPAVCLLARRLTHWTTDPAVCLLVHGAGSLVQLSTGLMAQRSVCWPVRSLTHWPSGLSIRPLAHWLTSPLAHCPSGLFVGPLAYWVTGPAVCLLARSVTVPLAQSSVC